MEISPCGVDCEQCKAYPKECNGCRAISGKVFWVGYMNLTVCPIYHCCIDDNSFQHCGTCAKLPCKIHYDTKDPAISDEEFEAGVQERAKILRAISSN